MMSPGVIDLIVFSVFVIVLVLISVLFSYVLRAIKSGQTHIDPDRKKDDEQ